MWDHLLDQLGLGQAQEPRQLQQQRRQVENMPGSKSEKKWKSVKKWRHRG
jgi:hypothetical protein